MTFKNWKSTLLHGLILFVVFIGLFVLEDYVLSYAVRQVIAWPPFLFTVIVWPLAGMLFGISNLITNKEKAGKWKINLSRILFIAIPAFIIANYSFLFWNHPGFLLPFFKIFLTSKSVFIFQLIFGYSIITSFEKEGEKRELEEKSGSHKNKL